MGAKARNLARYHATWYHLCLALLPVLRSGQCRRKCRSDIFNKILFITAYRVKIDFNCNCNIFSYNAIERYIATTKKFVALSGMQLYTDLRSGDIYQKHLCHRMKPWFPFFCFQIFFGVYIQSITNHENLSPSLRLQHILILSNIRKLVQLLSSPIIVIHHFLFPFKHSPLFLRQLPTLQWNFDGHLSSKYGLRPCLAHDLVRIEGYETVLDKRFTYNIWSFIYIHWLLSG